MDDLRVVFESRNRRACADRALVLESLQIPYRIVEDEMACVIVVPAGQSSRAVEEIMRYEEENPPPRPRPIVKLEHQNAVPGLVGYVVVVCAVAWFAGTSTFGRDWLGAGRIDGILLRSGEWWRTFTALTLHADFRHIAGNLVFGCFFGLFAGRLLGSGIAWLTILLAGAVGNSLNALLLESTHRSIGASTAVFATLGLLAGFVWRGKLFSQERWSYRIGPVVGGLALLMYTGTGDANTDVGAHLMGFVCGFAAGMGLAPLRLQLTSPRLQVAAGGTAIFAIALAWLAAFLA